MIDFASFQKYSLFGGFRPEDIESIRPLFRTATYVPHALIIREEERNDSLYFILQGSVRVSRDSVDIIDLKEGDCFGEMEILDVMPAAATVRAITPLTLAALNNRSIHEMYKLDPKLFALFMMNLARDLSRRLRRMDERVCANARHACREEKLAAVV
ncbi:MAG: cyclic nucleotide-binding domain-containing protein [Treponemataceae bacterium]